MALSGISDDLIHYFNSLIDAMFVDDIIWY